MKYKFDVKMTVKDMYEFLLYHNYSSFSGILGVAAGLFILALFFLNKGSLLQTQRVFYLFFAILILLFPLASLYVKARAQVKSGDVFKNPITYVLKEKGIVTVQGEAEAEVPWSQIQRVRISRGSVLLYLNRVRVVILPKHSMGTDRDAIIQFIKEHTKR